MSVKRSQILRGGGQIVYRGITVYTEADITVEITSKAKPLKVAMFGKISDSKEDVTIDVSFTPSGEITQNLINLFQPFFSGAWYPGDSPFDPVIDYPLVINSRKNRQLTIVNAACTTPPPLICAANKIFFGAVKFTGLRANGVPWSQAGSLFTDLPFAYPGDAPFNRATIIRQPFLGRWLLDRTGTITGATNANPSVITTAADHGLLPGDSVTISGSLGNTAINGTFTVAPGVVETTFSLYALGTTNPVAGNGAWTSGGTFTRNGVVPTGAITGTSNANPDIITTAADHGLLAGDTVTISGAVGDLAINGTFTVAPTDLAETTFTLYALGTTNPVAGTGAWTSGGTFTRTNVGDSFGSFTTEGGFTVTPGITLQPDMTDDGGVIDMLFVEANVKVECIPVGPTVTDMMAMLNVQGTSVQGNVAARGGDVGADSIPLYLYGNGIYLKVPLAGLVAEGIMYSQTKKRLGKVTWNSEMAFPANVPSALLQISTTPIA